MIANAREDMIATVTDIGRKTGEIAIMTVGGMIDDCTTSNRSMQLWDRFQERVTYAFQRDLLIDWTSANLYCTGDTIPIACPISEVSPVFQSPGFRHARAELG